MATSSNVKTAKRVLAWFSSGAASAVMCKLELGTPGLEIVNCDLGSSEDQDNHRFLLDCEAWFAQPITRIRSAEFANIDEVFEKRKYLSGIAGAPCTAEMKVVPRMNYEYPWDAHLFGYTADPRDVERAKNLQERYSEWEIRFPLIERGLTKAACFALLEDAGIKRPRIYDMGYPNGNCPGCVKATSPDYWALVRLRHPEVFARRAEQSRRFGARLARINGDRVFIDEIPEDWPILNPQVAACDFLCAIARQDIEDAA
jgi:hypothetical protein